MTSTASAWLRAWNTGTRPLPAISCADAVEAEAVLRRAFGPVEYRLARAACFSSVTHHCSRACRDGMADAMTTWRDC